MHPLIKMLEGGDRRSIGSSNDVAALVMDSPDLFEVLISGISSLDPLVSMRCADAAEKVTALHPEYLQPYKHTMIEHLCQLEQKEVRWHVAAMLPRLPLTDEEKQRVIEILISFTHDRSSIVKTFAMQALADLAQRDNNLRPQVLRRIEQLSTTGTPAMRARGKHLLANLRKSASS